MAVTFAQAHREVAQILNALAGAQVATRETAYNAASITTAGVGDSPVFNPQFIIERVLDVHGQLAQEICAVRTHPWRAYFASNTGSLSNAAQLPTQDAANKPIIGAWGDVAVGNIPLTWVSWEEMRAWLLHTTSLFTAQPYIYTMQGNKFYCSSATGTIECCVYDRDDYVGATNIGLPDVLLAALVNGAAAQIVVESMYADQAGYYLSIYQAAVEAIRAGLTVMPGAPLSQRLSA